MKVPEKVMFIFRQSHDSSQDPEKVYDEYKFTIEKKASLTYTQI